VSFVGYKKRGHAPFDSANEECYKGGEPERSEGREPELSDEDMFAEEAYVQPVRPAFHWVSVKLRLGGGGFEMETTVMHGGMMGKVYLDFAATSETSHRRPDPAHKRHSKAAHWQQKA
jgi:hypothetical protein